MQRRAKLVVLTALATSGEAWALKCPFVDPKALLANASSAFVGDVILLEDGFATFQVVKWTKGRGDARTTIPFKRWMVPKAVGMRLSIIGDAVGVCSPVVDVPSRTHGDFLRFDLANYDAAGDLVHWEDVCRGVADGQTAAIFARSRAQKAAFPCRAGRIHGAVKIAGLTGARTAEAVFAKGRLHGTYTEREWATRREARFSDGLLDGQAKTWLNDRLTEDRGYRRGKLHGFSRYFGPTGALTRRETWVDGSLGGDETFSETGVVTRRCKAATCEALSHDGKVVWRGFVGLQRDRVRDQEWFSARTGKRTATVRFVKSVLVDGTQFDDAGKELFRVRLDVAAKTVTYTLPGAAPRHYSGKRPKRRSPRRRAATAARSKAPARPPSRTTRSKRP